MEIMFYQGTIISNLPFFVLKMSTVISFKNLDSGRRLYQYNEDDFAISVLINYKFY